MRIKCDVQNLTIHILEQEDRIEDDSFYSTDDIEVGISTHPEAYYDDDEDGIERLVAVYLWGWNEKLDDWRLEFHNLSDFVHGVRAIEQYCEHREWEFISNFNIERIVLQ